VQGKDQQLRLITIAEKLSCNLLRQTVVLAGLLCMLVCIAQHELAAKEVTGLEDYVVKTLTTDEGLPMNQLNYLDHADNGFLWIATFEGLLRYDGVEFKAITHQDHPSLKGGAFDIKIDRDGAVWAFDTNHRKLMRYENGKIDSWDMDTLTNVVDYTLFEGWDQQVLILGGNRFYQIVDNQITSFPIPNLDQETIHFALFADDGCLWVAHEQRGLSRIKDDVKVYYDFTGHGLDSTRIVALEQGLDDAVWAISSDNDLIHISAEGDIRTYRDPRLSRSGLVRDMLAESDGTLWIGTQNGMFRFSHGEIEKLQQPLNVSEDHIFSIARTKEGSIAYSTFNNGLKILQKRVFKTFTRSNSGISGVARCIVPHPRGGFLVGTTQGVFRVHQDEERSSRVFPGLDGLDITDIILHDVDDIYFASYGHGLFHYTGDGMVRYTQVDGLASDTIYQLDETDDGRIMLGTYDGLDIFDGSQFENYSIEEGLPSNIVLSIWRGRSGTWWLSLASGGLAVWRNGQIEHMTAGTELERATIFHLSEDSSGTIWGGYSGGVLRIRENELRHYSLTGVFPRTNIFHVWNDEAGSLWLTSNSGLYQLDGNAFEEDDIADDLAYHAYLKTDGLPSNNVTALSNAYASGDDFWVPFSGGIVKVEPDKANAAPYFPEVMIENVTANGASIIDYPFTSMERYVFEPGLRYLRIKYTAPIFKANRRIAYVSRLKGFEDWQQGSRRESSYTNLAPGNYTFEVGIGAINDISPPKLVASFEFSIKPYFHQTTTFYILTASCFLLIGYLINYLRLRASRLHHQRLEELVGQRTQELQRQSEELVIAKEHAESANRIKSEFTANISHEIRTPMNSIMGFADILRDETVNPTHQHYLDAVLKSGDTLLHMIDDLLDMSKLEADKLSLHPRPTNLSSETRDTLRMFQPKLSEKALDLEFLSDPNIPSSLLIDATRYRQVLLNIVGNAIKFTDSGKISIRLELVRQYALHAHVRCAISDTGEGIPENQLQRIFNAFEQASRDFTRSEMGSGLGLAISKRLVEMMDGQIRVVSRVGRGSTFTVDFPKIPISDSAPEQKAGAPEVIASSEDVPAPGAEPSKLVEELLKTLFQGDQLNNPQQTQLLQVCTQSLVPALQVLDLDTLEKASEKLDEINLSAQSRALAKLADHVRNCSQDLDLAGCRRLRAELLNWIPNEPPNC